MPNRKFFSNNYTQTVICNTHALFSFINLITETDNTQVWLPWKRCCQSPV